MSFLTLSICILTHKNHLVIWTNDSFVELRFKNKMFFVCRVDFFPFWMENFHVIWSLCLVTWNIHAQVHFHLSVFTLLDCSSLIPVLWGGTMASSEGSCRKWLACIPLFHFLFSLILQSILIFSRWLEL